MRFSEQSQMAVTLGFLVCGRWPNIMQPSHLGDLFYERSFFLLCFFWIFEHGYRALGWKSLYGALCWINPQVLGKCLSWESWSGLKKKQQNAIWKLRMHHWFWQWMSKRGVDKLTVRSIVLVVSDSEAGLPKSFGPTGGPSWLCKPGVCVRIGKVGGTNILIPSSYHQLSW